MGQTFFLTGVLTGQFEIKKEACFTKCATLTAPSIASRSLLSSIISRLSITWKKNVEESAINDKKQAERKVGYLGSGRLKVLQIQDEDII